jgi:hypothetical protein
VEWDGRWLSRHPPIRTTPLALALLRRWSPGRWGFTVPQNLASLAALALTGANRHESMQCDHPPDRGPGIRMPLDYHRPYPSTLHADEANDHPACRQALRRRHVLGRIAREGIHSSQRLGHHRWMLDGTFAALDRFRRLTIRCKPRRASLRRSPPGSWVHLLEGTNPTDRVTKRAPRRSSSGRRPSRRRTRRQAGRGTMRERSRCRCRLREVPAGSGSR